MAEKRGVAGTGRQGRQYFAAWLQGFAAVVSGEWGMFR
jgi:hypothetical protein